MEFAERPRGGYRRWQTPLILLIVLAYFFTLSWQRWTTYFAADDMMNLGLYFRLGPWCALASQFLLWEYFHRPLGAAFYLPLYHWFGLNPVPFQVTILALLAGNLLLLFGLARRLGCNELVSGLAAFAASYHAGLTNLQYNIDMVYDVLCFMFFVGAMFAYANIRGQGRPLRTWEAAAILLLFVCALNSKEMAVTLPAILFVYEVFYHRGEMRDPAARWLRTTGSTILMAGILDLVYLYGRRFGNGGIANLPGYRVNLSLHQWVDFQRGSLRDLFCLSATPSIPVTLAVWGLGTYLAWRRDRPVLRFCWAYMLITPLPIAFLVEERFQGTLYIPLAGWAIFAAIVFVDFAQAISGLLTRQKLPGFIRKEGIAAAVVAVGVFLWAREMKHLKRTLVQPAAAQQGIVTERVIAQLRELHPQVAPHSKVIFLNDPFTDWDMTFIGSLWFRDRSTEVFTQRLQRLSPAEIASMDHVFDFQDGKLVQLK